MLTAFRQLPLRMPGGVRSDRLPVGGVVAGWRTTRSRYQPVKISRVFGWLSCLLAIAFSLVAHADDDAGGEGESSHRSRREAIRVVPFEKLNRRTAEVIRSVVENPSYYRRMPAQQIDCDPQMFTFLVRRPEVMVNIWEMMGITQVTAKRTGPYAFLANDGVGTSCKCELVYGSSDLHIYYGSGNYDGKMTPRGVTGRCVCILRSRTLVDADGNTNVAGVMDVFLKLDNLGADLLTRTFAPLVGKTADYNFAETAKFISQISQVCTHNPAAAQGLAMKLDQVDDTVRAEFATIAAQIAANRSAFGSLYEQAVKDATSASDPETQLRSRTMEEANRISASAPAGKSENRSLESRFQAAQPDSSQPHTHQRLLRWRGTGPSSREDTASTGPSNRESTSSATAAAANVEDKASRRPPRGIAPQKPHVYMRR
jgi:hypothetical protein